MRGIVKHGVVAVVLLVLGALFGTVGLLPSASASVLYVGGAGPGNYTTIQAAIDAAFSGDTVYVYGGMYAENVVISESISLIGEDKDNTIVNGVGSGSVVTVEASGISITGLTIQFGGTGIRVDYSGHDFHVSDSRIWYNGHGIEVYYSPDGTIENSLILNNQGDAIYLDNSNGNMVRNNTITDNGGGGIAVAYMSYGNVISDNLISSNRGLGIGMGGMLGMSGWGNTVSGNTISDNGRGIYLLNAWDNAITNNNIVNNRAFILSDEPDYCPYNHWDYNYWSDYDGTDSDGDGIGDTPYWVSCDDPTGMAHNNNYDPHPRMSPRGTTTLGDLQIDEVLLNGDHLEHVHVGWSVSGGNHSVVGFRIYRSSVHEAQGQHYQLTAFLPSGALAFNDEGAGEGNPRTYFYRVCALDIFDGEICATHQGAKFTRQLTRGPNLVSIPFSQDNGSLETVLRTVNFDRAWFYDSLTQEWKSYTRFKSYGSVYVNRTEGMWVSVTHPSNLTVAGIVPAQTLTQLYRGWNLVSFPSFNTAYTVADLKAETGATRVEGYDLAPPYFLRVLMDGEVLQAGYGYWVKVDAPVIWVVGSG